MGPMQWRTSGRRLLAAAVAAVVFHLLLALCVGLWPAPAPAPPRRSPVISVILQERPGVPAAPSVPASSPPAARASEEAPAPAVPHPPRTRSRPTTRLAEGAQAEKVREAPAEEGNRAPLTREEIAGEGLAREPGGRPVTTVLRDPLATLDPRGGPRPEPRQGPVHVPTREEALIEEKTRVESTLHGWTDDYLAQGRAEDPHDAYWRGMKENLAKNFEVDFDVSKREADRPTSSVREALAAYQRAAESYGKSGSAYGASEHRSLNESMATGPVPAADRGFAGTSLEGAKAAADVQLLAQAAFGEGSQWNKKLVVLIQIVQGPDGNIQTVQVTTTSGNKAYDGTALAQVRKLAGKGLLGVPPSGRRRTVWAFETDFSTMPPLPIGGCTLDAFFVPSECYYPLKRTVRTRIHLKAIY
jgi:hypothetical protein